MFPNLLQNHDRDAGVWPWVVLALIDVGRIHEVHKPIATLTILWLLTSSGCTLIVVLIVIVFVLVALLMTLVVAAFLLVWVIGIRIIITPDENE